MAPMQSNRMGASLFELLITLSVIGILLTIALPNMRTTMQVLAARAARETAFGMFARARIVAQQHGGAEILLDATANRIAIRSPSGAIVSEALFADRNVHLSLDGADTVKLRYDGYGLGRMMSRTITFTARDARAGLTVSSFGRVRRW
jgi:Tfp pilus assembly protein FimT